ncbi:MAG: DUF2141 domain-containing protein [Bacteroidota bacterium]
MTVFLRCSMLVLLLIAVPQAWGQEAEPPATLILSITGVASEEGRVGCILFNQAEGFPMDRDAALQGQEHPADPAGVTCRFEGLAPGTYAVAVAHDRNENGRTDTNFLGIPKESWAVSNNVRPRTRAPRFEEAAIEVGAGEVRTLNLEVR